MIGKCGNYPFDRRQLADRGRRAADTQSAKDFYQPSQSGGGTLSHPLPVFEFLQKTPSMLVGQSLRSDVLSLKPATESGGSPNMHADYARFEALFVKSARKRIKVIRQRPVGFSRQGPRCLAIRFHASLLPKLEGEKLC